jgi:hypothetical protein
MRDIITNFLRMLLPILRSAAVQTTADVVNDLAYGPSRRMNVGYGMRSYRRPSYASVRRSYDTPPRGYTDTVQTERGQFHDVLMVAFDITGPNMALAKEFILNYLPEAGRQTFKGQQINVDSMWIADDNAGTSDCDSAVFVSKGKQAEARALLRENGLVD